MRNSTFVQAIILGVSSLLWITSAAYAVPTSAEVVNLCVGEAYVIEAPAGHVFTYTNFVKAGFNQQALSIESRVATAKNWKMSDQDGAAVWTELRPNNMYLNGNNKFGNKGLSNYLKALKKQGSSKVVIQGRTEGIQLVDYYSMNFKKKKIEKHVAKVRVTQCGASTAVVNQDDEYWCRGQVNYAPEGTEILEGGESMYEFTGEETGRRYFASQQPGRVMFSHLQPGVGQYRELTEVLPNGEGACGYADEARLEALEGKNNYLLQVCSGDTWMMPTGQRVETVSVANAKNSQGKMTTFVETSEVADGFSVRSFGTGNSKVMVKFQNPDAHPATIYVESVQCD